MCQWRVILVCSHALELLPAVCYNNCQKERIGDRKMITEIKDGRLIPCHSLLEILQPAAGGGREPRIAAVGAGGKTSLLKALAEEYRMLGRKPVVTTTTHILKENSPAFIENPVMEELTEILEREGWVITGGKADKGRAGILPEDILQSVLALPCPVLMESDGARMLPVKIPASHEPVILPQTTCVLSVYGLDAVGKKIREAGFRPELLAGFLGKCPEDVLEPGDIALLAGSPAAGRKGVDTEMQYTVVLNKADNQERCELAVEIWRAAENWGDTKVIVTAFAHASDSY